MTRINVGILPVELCDAHLIAEYRELPRAFNTRTNAGLKEFRLGKGHQLWCAQFQRSLRLRQISLCEEMARRGFHVGYPATLEHVPPDGLVWSAADEAYARPLLIQRIRERLAGMSPRWTLALPPSWA